MQRSSFVTLLPVQLPVRSERNHVSALLLVIQQKGRSSDNSKLLFFTPLTEMTSILCESHIDKQKQLFAAKQSITDASDSLLTDG